MLVVMEVKWGCWRPLSNSDQVRADLTIINPQLTIFIIDLGARVTVKYTQSTIFK